MPSLRFLLAELHYRKKGILVSGIVVAVGVAVVTFLFTVSAASMRSIQLITKNMGQNLILVHDSTKVEDYYMATGREVLFPIDWVDTLMKLDKITTTYHVAILQKRDTVSGVSLILTGALPVKGAKALSPDDKKNPFVEIGQGRLRLGSEAAKELGVAEGALLKIRGMEFLVDAIEQEVGTTDDYRVFLNLDEARSIAGIKEGINAVLAMECLCDGEPLSVTEARIRRMVVQLLPDIKVVTLGKIAMARYEARETTDRYAAAVILLLIVSIVFFIVVYSWSEARQRERESALLIALGYHYSMAIKLYATKAVIISVFPAFVGFWVGSFFALSFGGRLSKAKMFVNYDLLLPLVVASLIICLLSFVPALVKTAKSDPVNLLREE